MQPLSQQIVFVQISQILLTKLMILFVQQIVLEIHLKNVGMAQHIKMSLI